MFKRRVLHGSGATGVRVFSRHYSSGHAFFGPGVYCTDHQRTASGQARSPVYVYELEITGLSSGIIDLNEPIAHASHLAVAALSSLARRYKSSFPDLQSPDPAYQFLFDLSHTMKQRGGRYDYPLAFATHLVEQGVWMLRGTMPPDCDSGRCDFGVQYVVLDDSAITCIRELTAAEHLLLSSTDSLCPDKSLKVAS